MRAYEELKRRATDDPNAVGLILAGTRGAGVFVYERSDYDAYVILHALEPGWQTEHGSLVEVWAMTLDAFRQHGHHGSPEAWNRPTFLFVHVELDKLGGEISRIVERKQRLTTAERALIAPAALDDYMNALYRALKNAEAGRDLEARLDALESLSPALTTAFALQGRVRPFNKYLRHELARAPLSMDLLPTVDSIAREARPDDQRALFRAIEQEARAVGFGSVVDGWEPDVAWLRGPGQRRAQRC